METITISPGVQVTVPEITDERLSRLIERVKYFVPDTGKQFSLEWIDPRNVAFAWDLSKQVSSLVSDILTPLSKGDTYHSFGHPALFKPSLAEVFAGLPEDLYDRVTHFSLVWPKTADDLNADRVYTNAWYHRAVATWYGE